MAADYKVVSIPPEPVAAAAALNTQLALTYTFVGWLTPPTTLGPTNAIFYKPS